MIPSGLMKYPRGKFSLPIIVITVCVLVFIAVLYTERLSFISSKSIFKFKTCTRKNFKPKSMLSEDEKRKKEENVVNASWIDDRFNPELALRKLKGKRLLFIGDSLQRNQWESFICLVEWIIPEKHKSMKQGRIHSIFKIKEYNATIEFYWAPYLVESNSDINIIGDPRKRIIKVDAIMDRATNWSGVDILVFNTYVWWMSGLRIKSVPSFQRFAVRTSKQIEDISVKAVRTKQEIAEQLKDMTKNIEV
ncbi:hypothetical protein TanjilG_12165 [Lupinus angustifolius]|uniref:Trichome birefringence-like C-terminal domain-containing protein n=1 Tax=Lupinus angustifolius TaxID=3871 RepID=A0A1J7GDW7_LUPAN|nr:hypothetical protein TanjilG_12165 [Lupinus angustifolius]